MGVLLHILTYACFAIFVIAVAVKFYQYQTMPLHLRWEIYPVPHEGHKAHYGGSYFEEPDWFEQPRKVDKVSEVKHMLPEMLLLEAVYKNNRPLWFRTFPFHFGMYNMIAFLVLLNAGAVLQLAGYDIGAGVGRLGMAVHYATVVVGFLGIGLGVLGALSLLERRLMNEDLKDFTRPQDVFNLVFLLAVFVLLLAVGVTDPTFAGLRNYVQSVITFDLAYTPASPVVMAAVALASLVVAYIPLTHMAHFVVKYFTYHNIRWEDAPNLKGGPFEAKIGEVLQYPVTWSAPHINPTGASKTWADVATEEVREGT